MNRVKVTCEIESYDEPRKPRVLILSHWNDSNKVVLKHDGFEVTVVASDLIAAIQNSCNTH